MSTHSRIGIINKDGTITGIYCHHDGYVSHNGRILHEHYTDEAKVRKLMALGDISTLGEEIGEAQDFDDPVKGQCNAYGRDRGETGTECKRSTDITRFLADFIEEYNYLWFHGRWMVYGWFTHEKWVWVKEVLDAEREEKAAST